VTVPVHEAEYVSISQTEPKQETTAPETVATEAVATTETVVEEDEEEKYSRFDLNRDGKVDLNDLTTLLAILFGYE